MRGKFKSKEGYKKMPENNLLCQNQRKSMKTFADGAYNTDRSLVLKPER